eukprot:gene1938-6019_t
MVPPIGIMRAPMKFCEVGEKMLKDIGEVNVFNRWSEFNDGLVLHDPFATAAEEEEEEEEDR